jgi:hypothetical protein
MEEVHLAILACTAVAILWADHMGFQYFRGTKQVLPLATVKRLHYAVWAGLIGMLVTGGIMASDRLTYLLAEPAFLAKMFFVGVLVVNSFFIATLLRKATEVPFVSLAQSDKVKLCISGGASTIAWVSAAVIGMFFL